MNDEWEKIAKQFDEKFSVPDPRYFIMPSKREMVKEFFRKKFIEHEKRIKREVADNAD